MAFEVDRAGTAASDPEVDGAEARTGACNPERVVRLDAALRFAPRFVALGLSLYACTPKRPAHGIMLVAEERAFASNLTVVESRMMSMTQSDGCLWIERAIRRLYRGTTPSFLALAAPNVVSH